MRVVEQEVGEFCDRAVYSDDMAYRYEFHRDWADSGSRRRVVWVLLNPATGDTDGKPRPTLGRCINWSKQWGYGGLTIINLFAYRATHPKDLKAARDPLGPDNDATLQRVAANADRVVAAWGSHGRLLGRGRNVAAHLPGALCLGHTHRGEPRHPLYVPATAALVPLTKALPEARFDVVRPHKDALTLLGVLDPNDTDKGWVRWIWEPAGVIVSGGNHLAMLASAPETFDNPALTRRWAASQRWGHLSAEGPWPG